MSVYIIRHKHSNNSYIGSTKDFKERKKSHYKKSHYTQDRKLYNFLRDNGGWDNFDMVEICKCENDKLREMEQYHMDFIKPSLNEINAFHTDETRREKKSESDKLYYENNKDRLNKINREY